VPVELSPTAGRDTRTRWIAALLILAVSAIRILYLLYFCPYDLAPDEAHYWDWSRHLDWSYYSKGPLIAWIIRAGCELFGSAAVAIEGTLMPAVRIPAVLCGAGLLSAIYVLTYQTFRSDRLALAITIASMSLPALAASSIIMTIDSPFLCCWAWALVFGRWAMIEGQPRAWPVAGFFIALGILAKYTMALWLVSAGLFLLFTPSHRALLFRSGFWVMVAVAGLSGLPILYWNSQNDWVTFRHVAVQAGVAESPKQSGMRWLGPLEYAGGQFLVLLGFWLVVWIVAMIRYRPRVELAPAIGYLWWMSAPTFLVFGASSLRASGQLNWPVAGYLSGAVLAAGLLAEFWQSRRPLIGRLIR
jgi:4-amino-4-deoxy-L-arabinose transferase-like glycosyltransferase